MKEEVQGEAEKAQGGWLSRRLVVANTLTWPDEGGRVGTDRTATSRTLPQTVRTNPP